MRAFLFVFLCGWVQKQPVFVLKTLWEPLSHVRCLSESLSSSDKLRGDDNYWSVKPTFLCCVLWVFYSWKRAQNRMHENPEISLCLSVLHISTYRRGNFWQPEGGAVLTEVFWMSVFLRQHLRLCHCDIAPLSKAALRHALNSGDPSDFLHRGCMCSCVPSKKAGSSVFMCERQTPEKVWTHFSGDPLVVMSENDFIVC